MRCEDITPHAADYLAGALPDETMAAIAAHVATCASCQGELAALDHTWQMLGIISPTRPDSEKMRSRFEAVLDGYQTRQAEGSIPTLSLVGAWWHPRLVAQLAGVAALVIVGILLGRQTASTPATAIGDAQLAALRQEVTDMREMVSVSLLQQQSATERLEGVAWTGRIERPGSEVLAALIDTLMHDPNVNVRLASIDALKRFSDRGDVRRSAIDTLPRQASPLVQIALIDFVAESAGAAPADRTSADALRRLSQDTMVDAAVRMRAAQALAQLEAAS